ncbi:hypothetical protein ACFSTD_00440 [Novosphingobium colocasiae]
MADVAAELAKGCPSSAWVVSICNSNAWLASTLSDDMQARLFRDGIPRMCGPSNGIGQIEQRGESYVVSGRWAYGSASHHADWALVPSQFADGRICMTALPMSQVKIEATWDVAGMKGTGSDTVVAVDVELQPDQVCELSAVSVTRNSGESRFEREATDFWVVFALLRAKALGVLLGAAEGLLEAVLTGRDKPIIYYTFPRRGDSAIWQAEYGKAAAHIGIARSIIEKHNLYNDAAAERMHILTYEERSRCRGECAAVADMLVETVERLMNLAGSSAYSSANPIQRYWRDFSIGMRHIIFNSALGYEVYGKQLIGVEPNIVLSEHV